MITTTEHFLPPDAAEPPKRCRLCDETKPVDEFRRDVRYSDGRSSYCIVCDKRKSREWRARNKERAEENQAAWLAANPGYHAEWRAAHPDSMAKWRAAHPDYKKKRRERLIAKKISISG